MALDADRLPHGVARVASADAAAPPVSPESTIEWDGEAWRLRRHEALMTSYAWDEVRLSCHWKAQVAPTEPGCAEPIDESTALDRLVADLRARGVVEGDPPAGPRLALTLIDTYLRFPRSVPRL